MPVITISGTTGSGAREIGQAVAERLGIDYVDQQLMVRAAQRCGVSVGVVAQHDERYGSLRERLSNVLRLFLERSASGADPLTGGATGLEAVLSRSYADLTNDNEERDISDSVYVQTMTTVIRELAYRGDAVILGRGSQMVLSQTPHATHVVCVAPQELRAERLAHREEIPVEQAGKRAADEDRARLAFYKKFWKVDQLDPRLYDITLNTGRVSYETAMEAVIAIAGAKEPADQPS